VYSAEQQALYPSADRRRRLFLTFSTAVSLCLLLQPLRHGLVSLWCRRRAYPRPSPVGANKWQALALLPALRKRGVVRRCRARRAVLAGWWPSQLDGNAKPYCRLPLPRACRPCPADEHDPLCSLADQRAQLSLSARASCAGCAAREERVPARRPAIEPSGPTKPGRRRSGVTDDLLLVSRIAPTSSRFSVRDPRSTARLRRGARGTAKRLKISRSRVLITDRVHARR